MATEKVAMLREEMRRCMQELNTLRVEELEAELLGFSFGGRKGYSLTADNDGRREKRGFEGDDGDDGRGSRRARLPSSFDRSGRAKRPADVGEPPKSSRPRTIDPDDMEYETNQQGQGGGAAEDEMDDDPHNTIWNTVAHLLKIGSVGSTSGTDGTTGFGVSNSIWIEGGMNGNLLKNLFAMITQIGPYIQEINSTVGSRRSLVLLIGQEYEELCSIRDSISAEIQELASSTAWPFIADVQRHRRDIFVCFDKCDKYLSETKNALHLQLNAQTIQLYHKLLVIARKTMHMATNLVQVRSMLKLYNELPPL
jgi:hypothetical protein